MRLGIVVWSSWVVIALGSSAGCKVSIGDGDDDGSFQERDGGGAGDSGMAGRGSMAGRSSLPSAGSGATDGGVVSDSGMGGQDGGGSGNGSVEEVPPGTKLADLDQGDADALCVQFAAEFWDIISLEGLERYNCTFFEGFFNNYSLDEDTDEIIVDVAGCMDDTAQCLEEGLGEPTDDCDTSSLLAVGSSCTATVQEYLACQRATAELLADAADAFTCEALGDPMVAEEALLSEEPSDIPACMTLMSKCPALFDEN